MRDCIRQLEAEELIDGRMASPIVGNQVALVSEGRAGPEVAVADSAPGVPMHIAFPDWNRLSRGR